MGFWGGLGQFALNISPIGGLYTIGASINNLTGGHGDILLGEQLLVDHARGTTYSHTTQALSGYQGATSGAGNWGIPVLNPATFKVGGDIINAGTKGLFGIDAKTALLTAGGLAVLYVLSKD